jgi:hypothetical protein
MAPRPDGYGPPPAHLRDLINWRKLKRRSMTARAKPRVYDPNDEWEQIGITVARPTPLPRLPSATRRPKLHRAVTLLVDLLQNGEVRAEVVYATAAAASILEKTSFGLPGRRPYGPSAAVVARRAPG